MWAGLGASGLSIAHAIPAYTMQLRINSIKNEQETLRGTRRAPVLGSGPPRRRPKNMKKLTFSKMVQNTKKPIEYDTGRCLRIKTRKNLHGSSKNEKIDFS